MLIDDLHDRSVVVIRDTQCAQATCWRVGALRIRDGRVDGLLSRLGRVVRVHHIDVEILADGVIVDTHVHHTAHTDVDARDVARTVIVQHSLHFKRPLW